MNAAYVDGILGKCPTLENCLISLMSSHAKNVNS